jgi:hypothetical protein
MKKIGTKFQWRVSQMISLTVKTSPIMCSRTELSSQANGKATLDTVMESRYGQMVQNTKANGKTTKLTASELSGTYTETNTKVSGREIRLMDMEPILIAMVLPIRATGETICNMARVSNTGMTIPSTMVSTSREKNTIKELTHGKMDPSIKDSGLKIGFMEGENTPGMMADNMTENGEITIWTDMVFTLGKMEGNMKANIKRIRNMEMESTHGPTEENTMENGKMAVSTEEANISQRQHSFGKVFGRMERERPGSTKTLEFTTEL